MRSTAPFVPLPILRLMAASVAALLLAGCDKIPGLGPDVGAIQREADAKAIGGACRHALRGVEDCYTLNPKATKAAVFDGWKEMDQYMRENKIDGSPSVITKAAPPEASARAASRAAREN